MLDKFKNFEWYQRKRYQSAKQCAKKVVRHIAIVQNTEKIDEKSLRKELI